MPMLQIRNLPEAVYAQLRHRAAQEHRSLAQQATVLIERALGRQPEMQRRRRQLLDAVSREGSPALPKGVASPEALVAEDRTR